MENEQNTYTETGLSQPKKNKMSLEQARAEVFEFLEYHDIDRDTGSMIATDAEAFEGCVSVLVKQVAKGLAVIDGGKFTLTLRRPQGDLKTLTVSGVSASDIFAADKAKKNDDAAKTGQVLASMTKQPFSTIAKLHASEFSVLSKLYILFTVV